MRFVCSGYLEQSLPANANASVVAPSQLLAAAVSKDVSQHRVQNGFESWSRTRVYTVETWFAELWGELRYSAASRAVLLSPSQELLLWRRVIEQEHHRLFDPNATAQLALDASSLIEEWQISQQPLAWEDHPDALQFTQWRKSFRDVCQREAWLTRADLWNLSWLKPSALWPEPAIFAGFGNVYSRLSPAFLELKRSLAGQQHPDLRSPDRSRTWASTIDAAFESTKRKPAAGLCCDNFAAEVEAAARWARIRFEQNPESSIAIFVPRLVTHRALVDRTFRNVFYPRSASMPNRSDSELFETETSFSVFRISAALPLSAQPVVAAALLLCQLASHRIVQSEAASILRSPFIAGAAPERSRRAFADLHLRKERELDVSLEGLARAAQSCPVFLSLISRVERSLTRMPSDTAEFPHWSNFISDLLVAVGWPGDAALGTLQQEAVDGWKNALSQLAALGLISPPVNYESALSELSRLLSRQGPSAGDLFSPIQILDSEAVFGLVFDSAFVTGLSDISWPPSIQVSPLIPLSLQRLQGIRGASPQSVQAERQRLTRTLFESARTVAASYSGRLSSLAVPYVSESKRLPQWRGKLPWQSFVPASFDEVEDTYAPPHELGQDQSALGGTRLIKAQSLCPFRAFAEFRLRAESPEDACFGFDPLERGSFVHDALKLIWEQLRSQKRLVQMPADDLASLVEEAIASVVDVDGIMPIHRQSAEVERERLQTVILDWLNYEKGRTVPFEVETVEETRLYNLAGLQLRLRVDRIDRLPDGSLILIDYKSGAPNAKHLKGERPAEPQLLVYAASLGEAVEGVFFGQLKPRDPKLLGFSHVSQVEKQKPEKDWDLFLHDSICKVEGMAREFTSGYAPVAPIRGACDYCRQKPLCRIQEKGTGEEEDSD